MKVKKVVIVGGVGGGASAAARVRRLDEFAQITIFEKGPDVSFSNCALPYTFSDVICLLYTSDAADDTASV